MAGIQEYKCPCCGGAIAFDSTLQKMKCPYCDTEFEMETLASYDSEWKNDQADDMRWEETAGEEWQADCVLMSVDPVAVKLPVMKIQRLHPAHSAGIRLL